MARTKSIEVKKKTATAENVLEKPTKRKRKPGYRVKQEIRRLQRSGDLLLPKASFERMVRSLAYRVVGDKTKQIRFTESAIEALQQAYEADLTDAFRTMNVLAHHAGRSTIDERDMRAMKKLFTQCGPAISALFPPGTPDFKSEEALCVVIRDVLHHSLSDVRAQSKFTSRRDDLENHIWEFIHDSERTKEELVKLMSAAAVTNVERMTMHDIRREAYLNQVYA